VQKLFDLLITLGPLGVFAISVLDSAGIPLPMGVDALLLTIAVMVPPKAYLAAALAVLGSVAGNAFLYYVARKGGEAYLKKHTDSPRAKRFTEWFHRYGLITIFIPAVVPIVPLPLKVFVLTAGATGVSFKAFLATILAGRIPRFLALAYLGLQVGENSMGWLEDHAIHLTFVAVGLFLVLYALVKFVDYRKKHSTDRNVSSGVA
jgi:membrane protein DedA with SNARE-associated domain